MILPEPTDYGYEYSVKTQKPLPPSNCPPGYHPILGKLPEDTPELRAQVAARRADDAARTAVNMAKRSEMNKLYAARAKARRLGKPVPPTPSELNPKNNWNFIRV